MVAVNLKNQDFDVRIDRKSRWGNPYIIGRDGDRADVIRKHRSWLWNELKTQRISLDDISSLHQKRLGCHCAPLSCHGDTLTAAAAWAANEIKKTSI